MPLSNPLGFKHHPLEGAGIYIYTYLYLVDPDISSSFCACFLINTSPYSQSIYLIYIYIIFVKVVSPVDFMETSSYKISVLGRKWDQISHPLPE